MAYNMPRCAVCNRAPEYPLFDGRCIPCYSKKIKTKVKVKAKPPPRKKVEKR